eukprot:TRINITY_DN7829_c0_g1_i1.p1 TRINITY_DN7829_c0_g1~~TRINITY_DN7829_c0_g1_i1.p1  ORF type:complete len:191 (-),score=26.79 TRINITY_DN7829_c0_g1_i1:38-610(-)
MSDKPFNDKLFFLIGKDNLVCTKQQIIEKIKKNGGQVRKSISAKITDVVIFGDEEKAKNTCVYKTALSKNPQVKIHIAEKLNDKLESKSKKRKRSSSGSSKKKKKRSSTSLKEKGSAEEPVVIDEPIAQSTQRELNSDDDEYHVNTKKLKLWPKWGASFNDPNTAEVASLIIQDKEIPKSWKLDTLPFEY